LIIERTPKKALNIWFYIKLTSFFPKMTLREDIVEIGKDFL